MSDTSVEMTSGLIEDLLRVAAEQGKALDKALRECEEDLDELHELLARALYALRCSCKHSTPRESHRIGGNGRNFPSKEKVPPKPVRIVSVRLASNGRGFVMIDDNEADGFWLSPKLTELLILAASGPLDTKGVVSLRRLDDATKELMLSGHNLWQLVHRLRKVLNKNGWNPLLVESNPGQFRFKTRTLHVIDGHSEAVIPGMSQARSDRKNRDS